MSERPAATRAYTQPMRRPERRAWATTSAVTCGWLRGAGGVATEAPPGVARIVADGRPALATAARARATRRRAAGRPLDRGPLAALQRGVALVTIGTSGSGLPRCRSQCLNPEGASARPPSDRRLIPSEPGVVPTPAPLPGPPGGHGGRAPGDPGLGPGAEGGRLPGVPLRRLPAGDLGDLPDPPELRGVHPRRPDLRRDHRVHGLADRDGPRGGAALRLAVPRVRQAHLRGLLDDGLARGAPPLPPDHALSPVLGLHERDLRADDVALRRPLLPRDLHRVPLVLRLELALGAAEGASRRDRRALEPPRHGDPVRVELLGHVHDLAGRAWTTPASSRGPSGRPSTTSRGCRSTSTGSSPTSSSGARSPPPTRPSGSSAPRPTRSGPATTGWGTSGTSWRSRR